MAPGSPAAPFNAERAERAEPFFSAGSAASALIVVLSMSLSISPTNWRFVQMYMNASVHIAKPNAPRANGIGALPAQQTGSQPGAVKRRASQIFAKYRSASTGGALVRSSSVRVTCPEPPQMSIARLMPCPELVEGARTVDATARTTACATRYVGSVK